MDTVAPRRRLPVRGLVAIVLGASAAAALAGRPLSVDDANTDDKGAGHVEAWVLQAPGSTVFNLAPAYAPLEGLELALALSHDRRSSLDTHAVVLKWRITASREQGCNVGATAAASQASQGGGRAYAVNALLSCNFGNAGSLHVNGGGQKAAHVASITTWGVAFERDFGAVTPHAEWFGAQAAKPTAQIGLRGKLSPAWQLDGTLARSDGATLSSVGLKFQF